VSIRWEGPGEPAASFLDDGFSAINRTECPHCGALYEIEEALVLHDVAGRQLYLVVPEIQRHRVQQLRAALLTTLAEEGQDTVPAYAFEPRAVVGLGRLKRALRGATQAPVEVGATRPMPAASAPVSAGGASTELPFEAESDDDGPEAVTSVSPEPRLPDPPPAPPAPVPRPALPPPPRLGLPEVPRVSMPNARPVTGPTATVDSSTRPLPTVTPPTTSGSERETLDRSVDIALESVEGSVDAAPAPARSGETSTQVKAKTQGEPPAKVSGLLLEALGAFHPRHAALGLALRAEPTGVVAEHGPAGAVGRRIGDRLHLREQVPQAVAHALGGAPVDLGVARHLVEGEPLRRPGKAAGEIDQDAGLVVAHFAHVRFCRSGPP
jgi:hypothetical protein